MPQLIYSEKVWRVLDSYRGLLNFEAYYSSLFLAHMALDLRVNPEDVIESEFLNSQVKTIFLRSLDKAPNADRLFSFAREWMEQFTENEITNLVINTSPLPFTSRATSADTSNSVLPLLNELMKKSKPKRCMDFCSGVGNAMILMARNGATEVHGIEINQSTADISYLRLYILKKTTDTFVFKITCADVFQFSEQNREQRYDFIFSEFPWGTRTETDSAMAKWHDEKKVLPKIPRNSDWKFIALANEHLSKDGKAGLLAPVGITFKQADDAIRNYFIDNGYIEQVIRLPEKMLEYTGMSALLLILSRGNKTIKFFDANSVYLTDGRRRYLPENEIQRFFNVSDVNMVVKLNSDVIRENRLDPSFHVVSSYSKGLQLQNLAQVIRARMIRKADLDKLLSAEATNIEFIRPKHLRAGFVCANEFLKEIPTNGIVLHPDDLLISRVGSKIVSAVYVSHPKLESVPDENLYVVRCDREKLNPYYLLAYLQSDLGSKHLAASYEGGVISRISLDALKKVSIPTVSIAEQNAIGDEMRDHLRKTQSLHIELDTLRDKIDDQLVEWFKG